MGKKEQKVLAELVLVLAKGVGPRTGEKLVQRFGSAEAAVSADVGGLMEIGGMGEKSARKVAGAVADVVRGCEHEKEFELVQRHGARLVCVWEGVYPRLLRPMVGRPRVLWVKGALRDGDAVSLAVVGARRCTAYGREQAGRLAGHAAEAGLCVVSGGAKGIDAAAHWAAVRAGGRTVAVLGSGLGKPYPRENVDLFARIVRGEGGQVRGGESGGGHAGIGENVAGHGGNVAGHGGDEGGCGCVMSEYPMMRGPKAENFPARNRLIAGMTLGTLVVEAAVRSGALITARQANEMGREVMAVPGRIDSAVSGGCHQMIREGWGQLVGCGADVLDVVMGQEMLLRGGDEVLMNALGGEMEYGAGDARELAGQAGAMESGAGDGNGMVEQARELAGGAEQARALTGGAKNVGGLAGDAQALAGQAGTMESGAGDGNGMAEQTRELAGGEKKVRGDAGDAGAMRGGAGDGNGQGLRLIEKGYSAGQQGVLGVLAEGSRSFEELVGMLGVDAGVLQGDLMLLEVRGAIERIGGGIYRRKR